MSAQSSATLIGLPDLRVELKESSGVPVVVNHSTRNIIGYVLRVEADTGITRLSVLKLSSLARNPLESAGIQQGARDILIPGVQSGMQGPPRKVHTDSSPVTINKISVDSVVFSDGEFAGPDTLHAFELLSLYVDATREFALRALEDRSQITSVAHAYRTRRDMGTDSLNEQLKATSQEIAANQLDIVQSDGPDAVRQFTERLSRLPKLWKGDNK